ncbi:MAG: carotenoid oxygenase family protein, partial [Pseudomonadota bacterium]
IAPGQGLTHALPIAEPVNGYLHSFAVTDRYLMFYIGPYDYQAGSETFVDAFQWRPDQAGRVLLVDKSDLSMQRWFDAPTGFVFHCGEAFECGDTIIARMSWYDSPEVMHSSMVGMMSDESSQPYPDFPRAHFASLMIHPNTGRVELEKTGVPMEFPVTDSRSVRNDRQTGAASYGLSHRDAAHPTYADAVVKFDGNGIEVGRYDLPLHHIAEELRLVADGSSAWLVGTFLDLKNRQTGLHVLNADQLGDGPVAVGRMPRSVALGFHGHFWPA